MSNQTREEQNKEIAQALAKVMLEELQKDIKEGRVQDPRLLLMFGE